MSVAIDYTGGAFAANKAQVVGTISETLLGYDLANASYDSVSFSVSTQTTTSIDIFIDSTGYILFVADASAVYKYSLSTAWDLSTASYASQSFSVSSQETDVQGLFFKSDGTKMYVVGNVTDSVFAYDLSTAWDLSTASYNSETKSVNPADADPYGLVFKPDGTKFWHTGLFDTRIHEWTMSTAWDVSTASYTANALSGDTLPVGLAFSSNGSSFFVTGISGGDDKIYATDLSTAWDVTTGSTGDSFAVKSQTSSPRGIFFKSDGTKMYVIGGNVIYQYTTGGSTLYNIDVSSGNYFDYTPTANTTFTFSNAPASGTAAGFALALTGANVGEAYDLANASYDSVSFSVATQEIVPTGIFFKSDGTAMYAVGQDSDSVYQYTLSTAWDVSSASYASKSFSFASQESNPQSISFKSDGSKLYVVGFNNAVYQYSLSTSWDISTASYDSVSFSVSSQFFTRGIYFRTDGTYFYIIGNSNDSVDQYSLSTAWDISTASNDNVSFSVSSEDGQPQSVYFNPDGTKAYILGSNQSTDAVYEYTLSTAWDLSTASYSGTSFSVVTQDSNATGITFKNDGSKMYVIGTSNDTVYQYTTGSTATATFTYPSSVKFPSGTAPDGPAIGETDVLVFYTDDGGTTYQGFQAGDAMA